MKRNGSSYWNVYKPCKSFFDALDGLVRAVVRLDGLGITTFEKILSILK